MIYKLKDLDELLKYHNNPLCERLVGVKGEAKEVEGEYCIVSDDNLKMRFTFKVTKNNVDKLNGVGIFFGYVNEKCCDTWKNLSSRRYENGLCDVVFNPFFPDGKMENFLKHQLLGTRRIEPHLEKWKNANGKIKVAVIAPENGRVKKDLRLGINFKRANKNLIEHFDMEEFSIQFYQTADFEQTKGLLYNFINKLDEIDRLRKDLVVIIRGGCDLDIPSIFDKVEAYAAIATMQTPTVCAIGHTDEHKDFKNYCDHYEETPSFLGITLGDWVEKYKLS